VAATRRSQLEVGEVVRPHGLHGAVVVRLVTTETERLVAGSRLATDRGDLVVAASRPLKGRHVVTFEGVGSVEAAEALRGLVLRGDPIEREGELWVDELIGATVVDRDGTRLGTIESVEANPASDLLVLAEGGLIPARFVVGQLTDGVLVVEVPEGLV
jgi:16S rRNA processing protein RimM